jgi:hypothetical protein
LVLSTNESLRWDEVREILRSSCDRIDPEGGDYDEDGHSRFYGYGRLNAERAARSGGGQARRVHGRRVHGRRVHGRRVHGRRVHGRSADDDQDLMDDAYEDAAETTRELLLATLLAAQSAQIQDLIERLARLERDS